VPQPADSSEQQEPPAQQHEQPSVHPLAQSVQLHAHEQSVQQAHAQPAAAAVFGVSAAEAPKARTEVARKAAETERNFFMGNKLLCGGTRPLAGLTDMDDVIHGPWTRRPHQGDRGMGSNNAGPQRTAAAEPLGRETAQQAAAVTSTGHSAEPRERTGRPERRLHDKARCRGRGEIDAAKCDKDRRSGVAG